MSAYAEHVSVRTTKKEQAQDVTERIRAVVRKSHIRTGLCAIASLHTTAGVYVNENADPDVLVDVLSAFRRAVPDDAGYRHAEGNAPAHIRTVMTGTSATVPVVDGDLALGTWQGIFLAEFDGPRERRLLVSIVGD
jgi:secondary thiamine-phosphate synthase enzyme